VNEHGVAGRLLVGDYSEESGARAVDDVSAIDGLFAANDEMAFGAMTRLRHRGLTVPTDISIIGFDDFGLSRVTTPSITTMHVPAERMARLATERLFDLVSGVAVSQDDAHVTLPVDLVMRESCGC
jgi:DNA-binding LacI/PurR family transcriptional regulator